MTASASRPSARDVVGEIALLEQQRRMATVSALTDVVALALPAEALHRVTSEMPEFADLLRALVEARDAGR